MELFSPVEEQKNTWICMWGVKRRIKQFVCSPGGLETSAIGTCEPPSECIDLSFLVGKSNICERFSSCNCSNRLTKLWFSHESEDANGLTCKYKHAGGENSSPCYQWEPNQALRALQASRLLQMSKILAIVQYIVVELLLIALYNGVQEQLHNALSNSISRRIVCSYCLRFIILLWTFS